MKNEQDEVWRDEELRELMNILAKFRKSLIHQKVLICTLTVALVSVATVAGGINPAAPKPEVPRILKKNKAAVTNFTHWIVFQHIGVSDKPISEFIIAFSSAPGASTGELRFAQLARIVVLSDANYAPISDFIRSPGNAGSTATAERGSFQVSIFTKLEMTEVFYMTPLQSEAFFSYFTAHLQKNPNITADVKKTAGDMRTFLSRIKAKK